MASMITTVDNPFDPRTHFTEWNAWDIEHGYNTNAYLARIAAPAMSWPQAVVNTNIEMAIDEIIEMHSGGMYKKLTIEDDEE